MPSIAGTSAPRASRRWRSTGPGRRQPAVRDASNLRELIEHYFWRVENTYFRTIYAPFGAHTDAQWRRMAETSSRRLPNGLPTGVRRASVKTTVARR